MIEYLDPVTLADVIDSHDEPCRGHEPTYQLKEGAAQTLLVHYPDAEKAKEAYSGFLKHYLPDADASGIAKLENNKWCGASIKGPLLAVVLEADSREITTGLLAGLIGKEKP